MENDECKWQDLEYICELCFAFAFAFAFAVVLFRS